LNSKLVNIATSTTVFLPGVMVEMAGLSTPKSFRQDIILSIP